MSATIAILLIVVTIQKIMSVIAYGTQHGVAICSTAVPLLLAGFLVRRIASRIHRPQVSSSRAR